MYVYVVLLYLVLLFFYICLFNLFETVDVF